MAAAADSYTLTAQVEQVLQLGAYGAGTAPTVTEVVQFMADRAGVIYARLRAIMGSAATGPPNYSTSINTSTDAGVALASVTNRANYYGAAIDVLIAAGAASGPSPSQRVEELNGLWNQALEELEPAARAYITYASLSETHISAGAVLVRSETATYQQGLVVDSDTEF